MLHNKRGSTLVTAMILMVFILMMGAVLIQWGLLNVQTTVNIRTDSQAYYTAKSVLDAAIDKLVMDNDTRKGMDEALKALAVGAEIEAQPLTLPSDTLPGDVTVEIKCIETDYTDATNCYGKQTLKMTVNAENKEQNTATEDRTQSASVAREFIITRTPPGSSGGVIGYSGGGASDRIAHSINHTELIGDVFITNATSVHIDQSEFDGNLYIDATDSIQMFKSEMQPGKFAALRVNGNAASVILVQESKVSTVYANNKSNLYRFAGPNGWSWTVYVPSGENGLNWGSLPTWVKDKTSVDAALQPLDEQIGGGYTVREYRGDSGEDFFLDENNTIAESGTLYASKTGGPANEERPFEEWKNVIEVNTGGGVIDLYAPKLNQCENQGVLRVTGGGEVNVYTDNATLLIAPNFAIEHDGTTIVNFVGQKQDGNGTDVQVHNCSAPFNVISVRGSASVKTPNNPGSIFKGAIYGKQLLFDGGNVDATETSFGSVVSGGSGGGTEATIACEKGKYAR